MAQGVQLALRPVLAQEKAQIWACYEAALRAHIEAIWGWDEAWQRAYFDRAFATASTRVVEADGAFAGYIQLEEGRDIYLSMLILLPAWRSRGIGARLLGDLRALSRARACGISLRVFRTNHQARRFYEREGWQVVEDQGDFLLMRPSPGDAAQAE